MRPVSAPKRPPLRRRLPTASVLALATLSLAASRPAAAQLLETYLPDGVPGFAGAPGVTVASRIEPAYQPLGVPLGMLVLHPDLSEEFGYTSNVFAAGAPQGSVTLSTSPGLTAGFDNGTDRIGAAANLDNTRYFMDPAQGRTDATGAVGGEVGFGEDKLSVGLADLSLHEDRTALDAAPSDTPIAYRVQDLHVGYEARFGDFSATPAFDVKRWRYDDTTLMGAPISEAYRDRDTYTAGTTLRYGPSDLRSLVLVLNATGLHYTAPQPGQPSPDATGWQALAGIDRADGGVWRYRLLAGWEERVFAASAYPDHGGPMIAAGITWLPSETTTVGLTATRRIEDAAQEGVGGYTLTALSLRVDHAAWRNLLLNVELSVQLADYLPGNGASGGQQRQVAAGGGGEWRLNRWMALYASSSVTGANGTAQPGAASAWVNVVSLMGVRFGL